MWNNLHQHFTFLKVEIVVLCIRWRNAYRCYVGIFLFVYLSYAIILLFDMITQPGHPATCRLL
jgi:hypothetical protein